MLPGAIESGAIEVFVQTDSPSALLVGWGRGQEENYRTSGDSHLLPIQRISRLGGEPAARSE